MIPEASPSEEGMVAGGPGDRCAGWRLLAAGRAFAGPSGAGGRGSLVHGDASLEEGGEGEGGGGGGGTGGFPRRPFLQEGRAGQGAGPGSWPWS